jgi:hypothetical protein
MSKDTLKNFNIPSSDDESVLSSEDSDLIEAIEKVSFFDVYNKCFSVDI